MGRLQRWRGVIGLALARVWTRMTRTAPRQVGFTVTGIALPIALLVIVTSLSLGLAGGPTVSSADVDYWIVPESGPSSSVVSVGGPRLGGVHPLAERLSDQSRITYATPVLLELVRVEDGEHLLAVGVIPGDTPIEIAGASTAGLAPGDPFYANGTYEGDRTDEVVLSAGAATLTGRTTGDSLPVSVGDDRSRKLEIVNVTAGGAAATDLPVMVMHLSELQSLAGATRGDQADQVLVRTTDPDVRAMLASVYPNTVVIEQAGLGTARIADSPLALALALAALAVALSVGVLFAATTLGMSVATTSTERAVLAAVGFSGRSRSALIAIEALTISLAGGILGVIVGYSGIPLANSLARQFVAETTVARADPIVALYGLGVALVTGSLVLPYLLLLARRSASMEALTE